MVHERCNVFITRSTTNPAVLASNVGLNDTPTCYGLLTILQNMSLSEGRENKSGNNTTTHSRSAIDEATKTYHLTKNKHGFHDVVTETGRRDHGSSKERYIATRLDNAGYMCHTVQYIQEPTETTRDKHMMMVGIGYNIFGTSSSHGVPRYTAIHAG